MNYKPPHRIAIAVHNEPDAAHAELVALFAAHAGHLRDVAKALGVNRVSLHRWVKTLMDSGYADPREGKQGHRWGPRELAKAGPKRRGQKKKTGG